MTGRQRLEAAFSDRGTDEFAVVVPYEDLYVRDRWAALTGLPWWYRFEPSIDRQLEWRRRARRWMDIDWFSLPLSYSADERERLRIEPREDGVHRVNIETGDEVRLSEPRVGGWDESGGTASVKPAAPIDSPEEIDRIVPPPDTGPPELEGRGDLARAILSGFGAALYPIWHVSSPLWCCYGLWGFEGLMTAVCERPELVGYACERFLEHAKRSVQVAKSVGARGIWIEECCTDMIGPESFKAINLPYVGDLVDAIRSEGLHSVYYFCGNPAGKWDLLLDARPDALALEEGKKGFAIDIEEVAERVNGRCALLGNLDAVGILEHGSDEQVRAEVERQLSAGKRNRGRFVMSIGSPVTPGTPVERVRLLCDIVHGSRL